MLDRAAHRTARRAAELTLQTSEERFRLMLEGVEGYAILMLDVAGNVATWNAGAQRIKGYRAEEIVGRHVSVFYPPEDVAAGKPERDLETAAVEGRLEDEGWRMRRDGTRFWANVVTTALRDGDGALRGYNKITRDLTERRVADLALHASEERFRRSFDEARIGMTIVDLEGRFERVNEAFCAIVGYSREQLIGRPQETITHPDDRAAEAATLRALLAGDAESGLAERRYLHAAGNTAWVSTSIALIRDTDRPLRFSAQVADITDRRNQTARDVAEHKRAEELRVLNAEFGQHALASTDMAQLKQEAVELVAGTLDAPFVRLGELDAAGTSLVFGAGVGSPAHLIDKHSIVVAASPQAAQTLRSGLPVLLESVEDSDALRPADEFRALGIGASATIPIRGKDAAVGLLHVGLRGARAFSPDDVTFLVTVATIVSMVIDRDRREQQIKQLNVDLQYRFSELEAFSYSVAHDLRGPLRAVAGFASALEEDYGAALEDEALRFIGLIVKGAREMGGQMDALLGLARVSRQELTRADIDLTALVRSIVKDLQAADPKRNAIMSVEDGLTLQADPALLRTALTNLLGNAWKFTRDRDPSIIRFESQSRDGSIVYAVKDNGVGFDLQYYDLLFAPFQRLHGKSFEGTGIGLATVARIVHLHRGRVWAESVPDAGATFYFTLREPA